MGGVIHIMKQKILIIDDDNKLNQLPVTFLGEVGFEVLTATRLNFICTLPRQ